ncbi:MAG: nitronate monooxygenase, partial [Pseudomonadales bacterium]|nr:nitronate monooxygenase [Pseudomonadales bacterium]
MPFRNRITELLGIEIPVVQAPMGWIARSQLASAVSNAGGLGVIETSSGELDAIRDEIRKMHDLTDKPFAVNIAQAFVRDPDIVQFVVDQGVKFVTTSAGSPTKYTGALKEAGLTVFHVVPTLDAALKAIDAGVDGLVVEGAEGGGFKNPKDVSTMVLLPLVRSRTELPIIAAGGIGSGAGVAAALALGADLAYLGTRFIATPEAGAPQAHKQMV